MHVPSDTAQLHRQYSNTSVDFMTSQRQLWMRKEMNCNARSIGSTHGYFVS
eukprot:m.71998 g.71998  ORF g.71998 m.71998 type:complete len:51 (-) comp14234_c0_seq1:28-180(-)